MAERKSLRSRFELVPGRHRPHPLRNGAIFLALLGFVLYGAYTRQIPFWPKSGQIVRAEVSDGSYLRGGASGTPVRVAGLNVGTIKSIGFAPDHHGVMLTMRITNPSVKIKRDATLSVYWRTLLGFNLEVALQPGSASSPPLGDGVIPLSQTQTQTGIDEVLQPLDRTGRQTVRTMLKEFNRGFQGPAAGAAFDRLDPGLRYAAPGLDALRGNQRGDLSQLLVQTSAMMGALGRSEVDLGGLIDSADVTLGVTAARRADLGALVHDAPAAMTQTQATMARLRTTLAVLDPLVVQLRPGVRRLAPAAKVARAALAQARPLLRDTRPLLHDLNPALRSLGVAGRSGTPLLSDLEPTLKRTRSTLIPWLDTTDPQIKLKNYEAIGPFFSAVDSAAAQFDAYGHEIHFQPGGGERAAQASPCQTYFGDPNAPQKITCDKLFSTLQQLFSPQGKSSPATIRSARHGTPGTGPASNGLRAPRESSTAASGGAGWWSQLLRLVGPAGPGGRLR
jgi:virulence factor Mce-like protein